MDAFFAYLVEHPGDPVSSSQLEQLIRDRNAQFYASVERTVGFSPLTRNAIAMLADLDIHAFSVDFKRELAVSACKYAFRAFEAHPWDILSEKALLRVSVQIADFAVYRAVSSAKLTCFSFLMRLLSAPEQFDPDLWLSGQRVLIACTDSSVAWIAAALLRMQHNNPIDKALLSETQAKLQTMLTQSAANRLSALAMFFSCALLAMPTRSQQLSAVNSAQELVVQDLAPIQACEEKINEAAAVMKVICSEGTVFSLIDSYIDSLTRFYERYLEPSVENCILVSQYNIVSLCESVAVLVTRATADLRRVAQLYLVVAERSWASFMAFVEQSGARNSDLTSVFAEVLRLLATRPLNQAKAVAVAAGYEQIVLLLRQREKNSQENIGRTAIFDFFGKGTPSRHAQQATDCSEDMSQILHAVLLFCHVQNVELAASERYLEQLLELRCGNQASQPNERADALLVDLCRKSAILRRCTIKIILTKLCEHFQSETQIQIAGGVQHVWCTRGALLFQMLRVTLAIGGATQFLADLRRDSTISFEKQLAMLITALSHFNIPNFAEFAQNALFCFEEIACAWSQDTYASAAKLSPRTCAVYTTVSVHEDQTVDQIMYQTICEFKARVELSSQYGAGAKRIYAFKDLFPGLVFRGVSRDKEISVNQRAGQQIGRQHAHQEQGNCTNAASAYIHDFLRFCGEIGCLLSIQQAQDVLDQLERARFVWLEEPIKDVLSMCQLVILAMPWPQTYQGSKSAYWHQLLRDSVEKQRFVFSDVVQAISGNNMLFLLQLVDKMSEKRLIAQMYLEAFQFASVADLCTNFKKIAGQAFAKMNSFSNRISVCQLCFELIDCILAALGQNFVVCEVVHETALKIVIALLLNSGVAAADEFSGPAFEQIVFYGAVRYSYNQLLAGQHDTPCSKDEENVQLQGESFRMKHRYIQVLQNYSRNAQNRACVVEDEAHVFSAQNCFALFMERLTKLMEVVRLPFKLLIVAAARFVNQLVVLVMQDQQVFLRDCVVPRFVQFLCFTMELFPGSSTYFQLFELFDHMLRQHPAMRQEPGVSDILEQFHAIGTVIYVNNPFVHTSELRVKYLSNCAEYATDISVLLRNRCTISNLNCFNQNRLRCMIVAGRNIFQNTNAFFEICGDIFVNLTRCSVQKKNELDLLRFLEYAGLDYALVTQYALEIRQICDKKPNDAFRTVMQLLNTYYAMDTITGRRFSVVFELFAQWPRFYCLLLAYCAHAKCDVLQFIQDCTAFVERGLLLRAMLDVLETGLRGSGELTGILRVFRHFCVAFADFIVDNELLSRARAILVFVFADPDAACGSDILADWFFGYRGDDIFALSDGAEPTEAHLAHVFDVIVSCGEQVVEWCAERAGNVRSARYAREILGVCAELRNADWGAFARLCAAPKLRLTALHALASQQCGPACTLLLTPDFLQYEADAHAECFLRACAANFDCLLAKNGEKALEIVRGALQSSQTANSAVALRILRENAQNPQVAAFVRTYLPLMLRARPDDDARLTLLAQCSGNDVAETVSTLFADFAAHLPANAALMLRALPEALQLYNNIISAKTTIPHAAAIVCAALAARDCEAQQQRARLQYLAFLVRAGHIQLGSAFSALQFPPPDAQMREVLQEAMFAMLTEAGA